MARRTTKAGAKWLKKAERMARSIRSRGVRRKVIDGFLIEGKFNGRSRSATVIDLPQQLLAVGRSGLGMHQAGRSASPNRDIMLMGQPPKEELEPPQITVQLIEGARKAIPFVDGELPEPLNLVGISAPTLSVSDEGLVRTVTCGRAPANYPQITIDERYALVTDLSSWTDRWVAVYNERAGGGTGSDVIFDEAFLSRQFGGLKLSDTGVYELADQIDQHSQEGTAMLPPRAFAKWHAGELVSAFLLVEDKGQPSTSPNALQRLGMMKQVWNGDEWIAQTTTIDLTQLDHPLLKPRRMVREADYEWIISVTGWPDNPQADSYRVWYSIDGTTQTNDEFSEIPLRSPEEWSELRVQNGSIDTDGVTVRFAATIAHFTQARTDMVRRTYRKIGGNLIHVPLSELDIYELTVGDVRHWLERWARTVVTAELLVSWNTATGEVDVDVSCVSSDAPTGDGILTYDVELFSGGQTAYIQRYEFDRMQTTDGVLLRDAIEADAPGSWDFPVFPVCSRVFSIAGKQYHYRLRQHAARGWRRSYQDNVAFRARWEQMHPGIPYQNPSYPTLEDEDVGTTNIGHRGLHLYAPEGLEVLVTQAWTDENGDRQERTATFATADYRPAPNINEPAFIPYGPTWADAPAHTTIAQLDDHTFEIPLWAADQRAMRLVRFDMEAGTITEVPNIDSAATCIASTCYSQARQIETEEGFEEVAQRGIVAYSTGSAPRSGGWMADTDTFKVEIRAGDEVIASAQDAPIDMRGGLFYIASPLIGNRYGGYPASPLQESDNE